jgi:hypothetical protein
MIKKLCLALSVALLPIMSVGSFSVDFKEIRKEKLIQSLEINNWVWVTNNLTVQLKECSLKEESWVAFVTQYPKEVVICTSSVDRFTKVEIAFILLHEHWHYLHSYYATPIQEEKDADYYAATVAKSLGFNKSICENWITLVGGWENPLLPFYVDGGHPSPLHRYDSCMDIFEH